MKLGVVAIARPTFDVPFAEATATSAWTTLSDGPDELIGSPELLMATDAVDAAITAMEDTVDALVVLQATFADSTLIERATTQEIPTVLWAFPEDRTGGRLRLNSFCGINLGAYALTNMGKRFGWIYRDPADPEALPDLIAALFAEADLPVIAAVAPIDACAGAATEQATATQARLQTTTIGRIGDHPEGFEPCGYDVEVVDGVFGTTIDAIPLPLLFERSNAATAEQVSDAQRRACEVLEGVDTLDEAAVERSLRFNIGLKSLADERDWSGVAARCWPETFTEFGGAMCTPMSMLNDVGVLGTCEADVYGDLTGLALQSLAGSVAFVADLVHLDRESNTGVFWHCGLAPFEMADPAYPPIATIHSNRKLPLLSEFPLKPGRVTIARFSRSRGVHRLVVGSGEMLSAPPSFSGTSGVLRFDRSVDDVLSTVMNEGLEHHFGIVYGDVREPLEALASLLSMPIVEL